MATRVDRKHCKHFFNSRHKSWVCGKYILYMYIHVHVHVHRMTTTCTSVSTCVHMCTNKFVCVCAMRQNQDSNFYHESISGIGSLLLG